MVNILINGDSTYSKLSKEDLEDIAKYICDKSPWFTHVNISIREDNQNTTTIEKVLCYKTKHEAIYD